MDQYYFKDHVLANTQSPIQYIKTNKRYVLHLCTAILSSWRLMKYCGGHNFPNNNVNTVTLFLMYRVIRISCLLRAILASSVAPLRSSANIALNKQEIRITRYIRKRVTVLTLLVGKLWPPQYFISLQENSIAIHKFNTYLLFASMKFSIASKMTVLQYINAIHISCLFLCTIQVTMCWSIHGL